MSSPNPRPLSSGKPYKSAAPGYYKAGWVSPLPVRKGQKEGGLPTDRTGRGKPYATKTEIKGWMANRGADNICLRMMPVSDEHDVIGIDVDDYMSKGKLKEGGKQLRALEKRLGPLPATWISTNRGADNVSGIRFFRAPAGLRWRGKADKDIDIISPGYRYAVVYPSWHPEGRQYEWIDPSKHVNLTLGQSNTLVVGAPVPDPKQLPLLPEAWVEELTNGRMTDDGQEVDMDSSVQEIREWAATTFPRGEGEPCDKVAAIIGYWANQIEEDASSHDKITSTHWNLACMLVEGHSGVNTAVSAIEKVWLNDVIKARGKRGVGEAKREIFRSGVNALRKLKAEIEREVKPRRIEPECTCLTLTEFQQKQFAAEMAKNMQKIYGGDDDPGVGLRPGSARNAGRDAAVSVPDEDDIPTYGEDIEYFSDDDSDDEPYGAGEEAEYGEEDVYEDCTAEDYDHTSLGAKNGYWPNCKPGDKRPKPPDHYDMTDRGNAQHWIDLHRGNLFWIGALNDWLQWTGKSWEFTEGSETASYARVEARQRHYAEQLYRRAANLASAEDPDAKAALAEAKRWDRWADRSGNLGPIKAALELGRGMVGLDEKYLNQYPHLLATMNGTLDLKAPEDGRLRETSRADRITLNTNCNYADWSDALGGEYGLAAAHYADVWAEAMRTWLPDAGMREYVQQLAGYTLHGENFEKLCVFLYGGTNTGKSTFLNCIMKAMGDYSAVVDLNIFKERATNPALVYALPKRLITMSEGSDRNQLHADVFKRLTGGDMISAELKYSNERVQRVPSFTPWIATNVAPNIPGADEALMKRMRVVPFNNTVEAMNGRRWGELVNNPVFAQVVLSWMVEGWNKFVAAGPDALSYEAAPMSVMIETRAFASEMSDIGAFARECLVHIKDADASAYRKLRNAKGRLWPDEWVTSAHEVYQLYRAWAKHQHLHEPDILPANHFGRQLKGIGHESKNASRDGNLARWYFGMKLTPPRALQWDGGTVDFTE